MVGRLSDPTFLTWLFVGGGLLLRLWHYALDHVIWYDEAVLLDNVLNKSFGELLGPTRNEVAAPPLYLWMLKLIHLTLGDHSYLWRLPSLLAGCGTLLLMVPLVRTVLAPHAAAFAVALLAVSDDHIRLTNTVKPYASDAFFAALLLFGLVKTEHWRTDRRLLLLAAVSPALLCASYPMAFVVGGLLLALWPVGWLLTFGKPTSVGGSRTTPPLVEGRSVAQQPGGEITFSSENEEKTPLPPLRGDLPSTRGGERYPRARLAWLFAAAVVAVTFALLYFGPIRAQKVDKLENEWERYYLPVADPVRIPGWLAWNVCGVCQFACNPTGAALAAFAPVGVWGLRRGGWGRPAVAFCGMFALVLLASAVRSYPFGQNRLMLFAAPAVAVLGAKGVEVLAGWRRWPAVAFAVAVVLVANGLSLWRAARPWAEPDARAVARFVRAERRPGDLLLSDEGNYLYHLHGDVLPLMAATGLPVGGRVWVAVDHYTPAERREYADRALVPLGFALVRAVEFDRAGAYQYERVR